MKKIIKENLKEYINKLEKEYVRCKEIDNQLTNDRSDNYYYHTRAEVLLEVIENLNNIIQYKYINNRLEKTLKKYYNLKGSD